MTIGYSGVANSLTWEPPGDSDVSHYNIYRTEWDGITPPAFPGGSSFATTSDLFWSDSLDGKSDAWDYFYFGTAVDIHDNEGDPTDPLQTTTTGVQDPSLPIAVTLYPCYPNPFNPQTMIRFDLPVGGAVELKIHDLSGRLVRTLETGGIHPRGRYEIPWNGRNDNGGIAAAGVYFCRLRAGDKVLTGRMTLLK